MCNKPFVSVIIPCLNEESYIGRCLDSLIDNDYPKEYMEIIVIDGFSEDRTYEILKEYKSCYPFIKILRNPRRITPVALNIGIKTSKGDIILRADAHSTFPKDYISKCVYYLYKFDAVNVGGTWTVLPRNNTLTGKSIALTYSHPFGSGNSYYKTGYSGEPRLVDTVPFGCYKRSVFDRIGYFNENLVRSQDIEFNKRLRKNGYKIILVPEIKCNYFIRSNYKDYFKHNFNEGKWVVYALRFADDPVSIRHLFPMLVGSVFSFLLIASRFSKVCRKVMNFLALIYLLLNAVFAIQISSRESDYSILPFCIFSFFIRHFAYSFGSLIALPRTVISKEFWSNRKNYISFIISKCK